MKYLSLFSGIEAASCAWLPLGWELAGVCEIEKFPCNVLKHHYPQVPNLGDITKVTKAQLEALGSIDLIVGGSPCQGFSVAGKQEGLNDIRSKLAIDYLRVINTVKPRWIVWENVPGVFSTNKGLDFRLFTEVLTKLGYGLCWRVLDAQYFGVAQRRRRVFLVGYLGDWRPAYKVLFESESLPGYLETCRRTEERLTVSAKGSSGTTGSNCLNPWAEQSKRILRIDSVSDCLCASEQMKSITKILDDRKGIDTLNPWDPQGKRVQSIDGKSPCLSASADAGGNTIPLVMDKSTCYDMSHPCDVIRTVTDGKTPTLEARMGTGGNQIPLVFGDGSFYQYKEVTSCSTLKAVGGALGGGSENFVIGMTPLTARQFKDSPIVTETYRIGSYYSNSMKSDNPNGGIYKTELSNTLDASDPTPACQQGGIAVCVHGSMIGRKEENGPQGSGVNIEKSFTLNTTDRHAVATQARVRKLTPTECLRLQGFPDDWFKDVEGYSDTAAYKAIGNSMAVPCMKWIGERIALIDKGYNHAQ